jgi:hypothetical protein
MIEVQPLLVMSDHVPPWLAVSFYAFMAGLPALLRWVLNVPR